MKTKIKSIKIILIVLIATITLILISGCTEKTTNKNIADKNSVAQQNLECA